jgi:hypothetical protein
VPIAGKYTFLSLFLAVTLEAFDGYQPPPEVDYTGVPWRVRLRWWVVPWTVKAHV